MPQSRAIPRYRRALLEQWIENAIALLDTLDGDPDLEDGADDEPSLGSHAKYRNGRLEYDLEEDDAEFDLPGQVLGGQGV